MEKMIFWIKEAGGGGGMISKENIHPCINILVNNLFISLLYNIHTLYLHYFKTLKAKRKDHAMFT